jgi:hypothetical protein
MDLEIRAGVEAGTEYAQGGGGFPNPHSGRKGRFVSVVNIKTPRVTDPILVERLRQLNDEISSRS